MIKIIYLLLFALFCFTLNCTNAIEPVILQSHSAIDGLSVSFVDSLDIAHLSWNRSSEQVLGYRIYRTNQVDKDSVPINFVSNRRQQFIHPDSTHFVDIVGVANGMYYYQIRPLYKSNTTDTIEGFPSNTASSEIFPATSFTINNGDIFITNDTCIIKVFDNQKQIKSIHFSDSITIVAPGDTLFNFGLKKPLSNFPISSDGKTSKYTWVLPKGQGVKFIYAEAELNNGTKTRLFDDIQIRPFRIEVKLKNEIHPSRLTMRDLNEYDKVIYKPWVDFSINIFNDSTFDTLFEYSLIVTKMNSALPEKDKIQDTIELPLFTQPLTGFGAQHNDQFVYRYNFSPDSIATNEIAKKVYGTSLLRADSIFNKIKRLDYSQEKINGIKEFSIKIRFKGKYFGEERIYYTAPVYDKRNRSSYFFDFYPPRLKRKGFDFNSYNTYEDYQTIRNSFTIKIESCKDDGKAFIKNIDLLIAKMPDSLASSWNYAGVYSDTIAPFKLTLDALRSNRFKILPHQLPGNADSISPVIWNIDISTFPRGKYIFAYITEDEFGNSGIAKLHMEREFTYRNIKGYLPVNPYHLNIVTGKSEL